MYKCHRCNLETKQLNSLMGRHWKKHCNDDYTKEQYKKDLLAHNGRPPKICPMCNKETSIPKGEKDYPTYHKKCYVDNKLNGDTNPNYRGGKSSYSCRNCNKLIKKYSTSVLVNEPFCSTSCSGVYYAEAENRTKAQLNNDKKNREMLRKIQKTDKFKKAHCVALAKMQQSRKSKIEEVFYEQLLLKHPDTVSQHIIDYYTFDAFVPSTNELFEVNGNYWHNKESARARDRSKVNFVKNSRDQHLNTIWENEILDLQEEALVEHSRKKVQVYILAGPNGCGKSHIAQRLTDHFIIVDYDKMSIDKCIEVCKKPSNKPYLLVTPIQAKRIGKLLRQDGIRTWSVYLREPRETIVERIRIRNGNITNTIDRRIKRYESLKDRIFQFYGKQEKVFDYLLNS